MSCLVCPPVAETASAPEPPQDEVTLVTAMFSRAANLAFAGERKFGYRLLSGGRFRARQFEAEPWGAELVRLWNQALAVFVDCFSTPEEFGSNWDRPATLGRGYSGSLQCTVSSARRSTGD